MFKREKFTMPTRIGEATFEHFRELSRHTSEVDDEIRDARRKLTMLEKERAKIIAKVAMDIVIKKFKEVGVISFTFKGGIKQGVDCDGKDTSFHTFEIELILPYGVECDIKDHVFLFKSELEATTAREYLADNYTNPKEHLRVDRIGYML